MNLQPLAFGVQAPVSAQRRITRPEAEPGLPSESFRPSGAQAPGRIDCPKPMERVRAEIGAALEALADQACTGVKHTTRSMPRLEHFVPQAPRPFGAGRFHAEFEGPSGKTGLILQTEAGPGHLARIVPGETVISGGYASILADPANPSSAETVLNRAEERRLLETLYAKFEQPMTRDQSEKLQGVLDFAAAVHFREGGSAAQVAALHADLSRAVQAKHPQAEAGWNLR